MIAIGNVSTTVVPIRLHRPFTIERVHVENYSTRTLVFRHGLTAEPGQFVMAWLPGVDEKPFSIASARPLALTVAAVGPFSRALHTLSTGDRVWVRGPLGQGFHIDAGHLLLAGGGYGVAPLLFLAREAIAQGCTVEVCIGARSAADVLLVKDLEEAGAALRITTEDGSLGIQGLVTAAVETAIASRHPRMVYACGPVGMLKAIDRLCQSHGLPSQLSWEAHMRCGMGLCGSCELPAWEPGGDDLEHTGCQGSGWLVCLDGPVSFSEKGQQQQTG